MKRISKNDKIFIAGANGMVGLAIKRSLKKAGYGDKLNNGCLLTPSRKELDLINYDAVKIWFSKNKPTVVILAC